MLFLSKCKEVLVDLVISNSTSSYSCVFSYQHYGDGGDFRLLVSVVYVPPVSAAFE